MAKAKEVAVEQDDNLPAVITERPSYLAPVGQGGPRGSENVGTSDIIIPRLEIVQALSPVRKKTDPQYIEGAEEGDIFNTVTRELLGRQVIVVPVLFRKEFLIWKSREHGGGFKGSYGDEQAAKAALESLEDKAHCKVNDTGQHFCLLIRPDRLDEVVVSMAVTKLKVSRQWNSLVRMTGMDRFAHSYLLETVPESNAKGTWFNWKVSARGYAPEIAYKAGEKLYEQVRQGRIIEADRSDIGSTEEAGKAPSESEY